MRDHPRLRSAFLSILPAGRHGLLRQDGFSHLLFMAFDGFAVNCKLNGRSRRAAGMAENLTKLLTGEA